MADPKDKSEGTGVTVDREEMVEFLTSTGSIRRGLAESLYEQGLNTWERLLEGNKEYFTSFKGIGGRYAIELNILSNRKKEELSGAARDLADVLSGIPRITRPVIDNIMDAGFKEVYRIATLDPSDLRNVPGVGPKLSGRIVEACREEVSKHPISNAGVEEAMPLPSEEEGLTEKGEGLFSKLLGRVRSFFSTEKENTAEPAPEAEDKEAEIPPAEEEREGPVEGDAAEPAPEAEDKEAEIPPAEEEREGPAEGDTAGPMPEAEDKGTEKAPDEEAQAVEDAGEVSEEKVDKKPKEEEEEKKEPAPPAEEKRGLWDKIKGMFGGKVEKTRQEEEEQEASPREQMEVEAGETEEELEPGEASSDEEKVLEKEAREEPRLEIEDIHHIPGVDRKTANLLHNSGYMSLEELREAVPEDLMMIDGIDEDTANYIYEVLRK